MTNQWLIGEDYEPIAPVNTGDLRRLLQQLDDTIAATAKFRNDLDAEYPRGNPARAIHLDQLQREAERQAKSLDGKIREAFSKAEQHATTNRNKARARFAKSDEGRDFLRALPGYVALASSMTPDALADRLNGLLDSGLIGQSRALADAAQSAAMRPTSAGNSGRLSAALHRAATEAASPLEVAADSDAAYIATAKTNYLLFAGQVKNRLESALQDGNDYAAGNFSTKIL